MSLTVLISDSGSQDLECLPPTESDSGVKESIEAGDERRSETPQSLRDAFPPHSSLANTISETLHGVRPADPLSVAMGLHVTRTRAGHPIENDEETTEDLAWDGLSTFYHDPNDNPFFNTMWDPDIPGYGQGSDTGCWATLTALWDCLRGSPVGKPDLPSRDTRSKIKFD